MRADERVRQQDAGSGGGDTGAGADEEAGADDAADGDHRQMTVLETGLEAVGSGFSGTAGVCPAFVRVGCEVMDGSFAPGERIHARMRTRAERTQSVQ